jgi:peptidyl-prolyl cis-trans isomerase A (cyclophilin A)
MDHRVSFLLAPAALSVLAAVAGLGACSSTKTSVADDADASDASVEPVVEASIEDTYVPPPAVDAGPDPLVGCTKDPGAPTVTVNPNSATDPIVGGAAAFTLAKALEGFPATGGKLTAGIRTEYGVIRCTLDEVNAPISVANFIGLARGTRPFVDDKGKWKTGHFYDGLIWHRVIPQFVIQGGDPDGLGTGGPGYDLVKENQIPEPFGALAMAASAEVSGSQFYIVVAEGADAGPDAGSPPAAEYNVFGACDTVTAVAISKVPRDRTDYPDTPVHMTKVEIGRCP